MDEIFTTLPHPRSCMPGTTCFMRATADQRLASITMWKSASDELTRSDVPRLPPTLFTRMSMGPSSASVLATRSAAPDSSPRSATNAPTFTPVDFSSSAVWLRIPSPRAQIATFTPSAASASADWRPSPRLPPVTRATLPLIPRSMLLVAPLGCFSVCSHMFRSDFTIRHMVRICPVPEY